MEAAAECDDGGPAGESACNLHGVLHRLSACGDEHCLLSEVTRSGRVQALRQADVGFVGRDVEASMGERFRLLGYRRHDGRVTVTGVEHRDASREVDVTLAVDIPQLRILRAGCIECLGRDTPRNGGLVALGKSHCCTHRGSPIIHALAWNVCYHLCSKY